MNSRGFTSHFAPMARCDKFSLFDPCPTSKAVYLFTEHFARFALSMLDMVRDIGTFWKTNKEHIWLPNIKQGFFGITRPTEKEMAKYR